MTSPYGQKMIHRGAITDTSTVAGYLGSPGDIRIEGNKKYRLVLSGTTIASVGPARLLMLDSTSDGYTGYTVEKITASNARVFGINMTGAAIAVSTYFWAQVEGHVLLDATHWGAAIAANTPVMVSSDYTIQTSTGSVAHQFGTSMVAVVSTTTGNLYIKCYGA